MSGRWKEREQKSVMSLEEPRVNKVRKVKLLARAAWASCRRRNAGGEVVEGAPFDVHASAGVLSVAHVRYVGCETAWADALCAPVTIVANSRSLMDLLPAGFDAVMSWRWMWWGNGDHQRMGAGDGYCVVVATQKLPMPSWEAPVAPMKSGGMGTRSASGMGTVETCWAMAAQSFSDCLTNWLRRTRL
jgi:hypothetical protein